MFAQQETVRIIEGLLSHLDNDTNVDAGVQLKNPVSAYTSADLAAQEWQAFFQDYPHLLGLSSDLPESGSFMTSTDLGKPILATRDDAGQFRAFLNVCRHRGTIVEDAERGQKTALLSVESIEAHLAFLDLGGQPPDHSSDPRAFGLDGLRGCSLGSSDIVRRGKDLTEVERHVDVCCGIGLDFRECEGEPVTVGGNHAGFP